MKLSLDLWSLNVFIPFRRTNVCMTFQRLKGYDVLIHASADFEAVAFHMKRWDLEKQVVRSPLGDHKASHHRVLYSKGLAQFQITASRAIVNHDAFAPANPRGAGGLKVKYKITCLI